MFTCLCCDELLTMRSRSEGGKKFAWKAFHVQKYFKKKWKAKKKSFTHIITTIKICLSIYFFMYMFILQQVCYYVLHRHIQQAKREREKESECLLYFRIPALEVYKLFFFLIQISVWLLMGSFIIHRFSITERILLLWQNFLKRFKVHFFLLFALFWLLWKNQ